MLVGVAGFMALALVLDIAIGNTVGRLECSVNWDDSGMRHRFEALGGCKLEIAPGKWVPAETYRSRP